VQGACERIANTPLPFPYALLVHRTAYMYVGLAPFAMASGMGWWTPLFNAIVAYTFFGLDELARQLVRFCFSIFRAMLQCSYLWVILAL